MRRGSRRERGGSHRDRRWCGRAGPWSCRGGTRVPSRATRMASRPARMASRPARIVTRAAGIGAGSRRLATSPTRMGPSSRRARRTSRRHGPRIERWFRCPGLPAARRGDETSLHKCRAVWHGESQEVFFAGRARARCGPTAHLRGDGGGAASAAWDRVSPTAEPRSAYLLSGASRWEWEHSIPAVEALRYSIAFRNLREGRALSAEPSPRAGTRLARSAAS